VAVPRQSHFPVPETTRSLLFRRPVGLAGSVRAWSLRPRRGRRKGRACLPMGAGKRFDVTLNSLKEKKKRLRYQKFMPKNFWELNGPLGFGVPDGSNHVGPLNVLG
ncbi:hypothetical protein PVAP13_5NG511286, partial [Panicum virgatum]